SPTMRAIALPEIVIRPRGDESTCPVSTNRFDAGGRLWVADMSGARHRAVFVTAWSTGPPHRVRPQTRRRDGRVNLSSRCLAPDMTRADACSRAGLEAQTAFWILPAFRHFVQTYTRWALPFTIARTRWRFGSKRRLVATIEWLR